MTRRGVFLLAILIAAGVGGYMLFFHKSSAPNKLGLVSPNGRQFAAAHGHKAKPRVHPSTQHQYAVAILPALDRSRTSFDRALIAVTNSDSSTADTVCGTYGENISMLSGGYDGIAHPWPWYSKLGYMHHTIMGIYHNMLGALQSCQTSVAAGDSSILQTAIADMADATSRMRNTDDYVRWLTHQR